MVIVKNLRSMLLVGALAVICSTLPFLVDAQSDLQSSIRAAIAADPRTAELSEAQIEAMVAALSQQAQQQGITPADIAWRPGVDIPAGGANEFCAPYPAYLCVISASYGFLGPDYTLPLWLGVSALLLLLLFQLRRHHEQVGSVIPHTPAPSFAPPQSAGGNNLQS